MKKRRLPAPWTAEKVEGGYRVKDDHGHGFIAVVPQLPGCSAFGKSMEKAARELQYAIDAWIDAAKAAGRNRWYGLRAGPKFDARSIRDDLAKSLAACIRAKKLVLLEEAAAKQPAPKKARKSR